MQAPERQQDLNALLSSYAHLFDSTSRILEIGTGTGSLIPSIRALTPIASVLSIDFAHAMLQHARIKFPHANLIQADAAYLPFSNSPTRDSSFDLIICHNAFPHFNDPLATLQSMAIRLLPGSPLLILHDQSRQTVNALHQKIGGAIAQDLLPEPQALSAIMVQAGLGQVEVEDGVHHFHAIGQRAIH